MRSGLCAAASGAGGHWPSLELLKNLATESLPLATIGMGQRLLHLHHQLVLEFLREEQLAQKVERPRILR
jgi:hypothetical protein